MSSVRTHDQYCHWLQFWALHVPWTNIQEVIFSFLDYVVFVDKEDEVTVASFIEVDN